MVIVRKITRQDLPRILELYEQLTEEKQTIPAETLDRVFEDIGAMPNHEILAAEENGIILGTALVQVVPNLSHGARPWGIVENVVVDSHCRRLGTGRLLMEHIIDRCRQAGCYKVQLMSNIRRKEAHQFYRALGFQESSLGFRLYL